MRGVDKDEGVVDYVKPQNKKIKMKQLKSTAPCAVSKPGTYYRIINTYISEHNCPDAVKTGSNPTIADLDSQCFLHWSIYDKLFLSNHDFSCDAFSGFAFPEVF